MVEPLPVARHHLAQVDPAALIAALPPLPHGVDETVVTGWASRHWPLVGRRAACDDEKGFVPLGLPLPPNHGRHRLTLSVPADAIRAIRRPPLLQTCLPIAPAAWRDIICDLLCVDAGTRCFGSLAWQFLTGLPYLTSTSDLDLIWTAGSAGEADALLDRIAQIARRAPMRIDGELLTPSGRAVQWREWQSGAAEIVAKSGDGVELIRRKALFA